jgi:hypothetical protein
LPTRLIRPAFQHIVNRDLPANTKALRALFQGGSEPKIFLTFETDSDGIAFINETFARSGAEWEIFDANDQRFELGIFPMLYVVQRKTGLGLFDRHSIEKGRFLTGHFDHRCSVAYMIFVDDGNSTVYMGAGVEAY